MAKPEQKVGTSMCARCRGKFKVGDRTSIAYIVTKVGYNAESKDFGAWLHSDFELVHVVCADPGLEAVILT